MNVRRFTARTSREALRLVREALGDDAVVLSTRPSAGGVEVLAMAPEAVGRMEQIAAAPATRPRPEPALDASSAEQDAERLEMSTLSFQDYVRNRMLKRRAEAIEAQVSPAPAAPVRAAPTAPAAPAASRIEVRLDDENPFPIQAPAIAAHAPAGLAAAPAAVEGGFAEPAGSPRPGSDLLSELRSVKGLIEERFGMLAFLERLQRRPAEARLTQKLLDCGFSPILVRKLADGLGADVVDENDWAAQVLERNLQAAESGEAIEDRGGVFALIGATGVGKTTTAAKIAAAFAARHGAGNLGLITLDAYRVGAHEQLRAYGRILGVPVHTAHDRASLEDLLELLSAKKMILIDTAGMAQRDTRTRELLDMLSHRSVQRLLVVNAAAQGETIEDVLLAYRAATCTGMILSKLDEAVKLGPALDAAIRHKLKIVGIANGQRVPEDWHRLSSSALVQRALRGGGSAAWRLDAAEMSLIFTAPRRAPADAGAAA
jgi:flagellar biosynthesis protein FlhF